MKRLLAFLALALWTAPALAQQKPYSLTPTGYQQITSLGSAASLTIPANTQYVVLICTGQTVYWRDDGTAPTATVGMPLTINTELFYGGNLKNFQVIQTSATATCNASYYR